MFRGSDPAKRQAWTERLDQFSKSGQTVAQFCRDHGLSEPSFYQWGRKLREDRKGKHKVLGQRQRGKGGAEGFKMVQITPVSSGVKVRLPDGIVIDLGTDSSMVEKVLRQLLDHHAKGAAAC